ncbi:MAG: HAD-IIA family hydrolase [Nannocystis sp.]|nr:HAD-IIA family hydrolase [Nannocystis sp.]MBA3546048.1 HAD-IIA family hydrolase [Nannocystis sp.]
MNTLDPLQRLRACRGFLLDMDGTIYVDEQIVPGALEFIRHLDATGRRYLFLTNNSAARAADYHARLERIGIRVPRAQVMTAGDATIGHLLTCTPYRSAFVLGTPALVAEFESNGIDTEAADPDCVVLGFDLTLTFARLERACTLLFAGKPYYATHPDRTCITTHGLIPDIGAIIAACHAVTGRSPKIIGKPEREIVDDALRRLGVSAEHTAMVGDQLDTDMTMARRADLSGVLVMSGETTEARLAAWPPAERPSLIVPDIGHLVDLLR